MTLILVVLLVPILFAVLAAYAVMRIFIGFVKLAFLPARLTLRR